MKCCGNKLKKRYGKLVKQIKEKEERESEANAGTA